MQRVATLLLKEMKPLGLEGAATFDPVAGIMLWREQRRAAAAAFLEQANSLSQSISELSAARGAAASGEGGQ